MVSIVRHSDLARWKSTGAWVLVYGRRKVGKSYFIRNFTKWDSYYFVGREGEIFVDSERISYEAFRRELAEKLKHNETVVVDEFQRLPSEFSDMLHSLGTRGRLVAVSSTLWLSREILSGRSPLLGMMTEFKMGLVDEADILVNLSSYVSDPKRLVEVSVLLREPWLTPVWERASNFERGVVQTLRYTVPALVGEVFREEERFLSRVYEGVLKAVASGKSVSSEIAAYLYSNRLMAAQDPSLVHPYLRVLERIGILEKVKFYGKNRYMYRHVSPVVDLFFYMDAKYGISERELEEEQALRVLREKMPLYVEQFVAYLLSKSMGLWAEKIVEPGHEVDVALVDFKSLKAAVEVKWRETLTSSDVEKIEERLSRYKCRKILVVPRGDVLPREPKGIEVFSAENLLELARTRVKKLQQQL
ncbi:ATP-binding protein [Thermofilum pendens]|uniref:AAA family ATPase n=1 Tax=Thermofilum pendens TaxID=2269 RepID=UPI001FE06A1E|nr:AAA family ATPase [Thermofilum pendens]